jgi:hypothetical protein
MVMNLYASVPKIGPIEGDRIEVTSLAEETAVLPNKLGFLGWGQPPSAFRSEVKNEPPATFFPLFFLWRRRNHRCVARLALRYDLEASRREDAKAGCTEPTRKMRGQDLESECFARGEAEDRLGRKADTVLAKEVVVGRLPEGMLNGPAREPLHGIPHVLSRDPI